MSILILLAHCLLPGTTRPLRRYKAIWFGMKQASSYTATPCLFSRTRSHFFTFCFPPFLLLLLLSVTQRGPLVKQLLNQTERENKFIFSPPTSSSSSSSEQTPHGSWEIKFWCLPSDNLSLLSSCSLSRGYPVPSKIRWTHSNTVVSYHQTGIEVLILNLCLRPADSGGYVVFYSARSTLRHTWLMSSSLAHTAKHLWVILALYKEQVNRNNQLTDK